MARPQLRQGLRPGLSEREQQVLPALVAGPGTSESACGGQVAAPAVTQARRRSGRKISGCWRASSAWPVQRHNTPAKSVTPFQIARALGALAALTKQKVLRLISLALGAVGLFFLALGCVQHRGPTVRKAWAALVPSSGTAQGVPV